MIRKRIVPWRWVLVVILLAAFALRLHHLGAQSLWYDETVSVYLAGEPLADLVEHTAGDIHPPGYYLLLKGWLVVAGYPSGHADAVGHGLEFMAALLSLCSGMLLVALIFLLGRQLYDRPVALLAAALTAISPFSVWYSQEVRMYTVAAAAGLVCLMGMVRLLQAATVARTCVPGAAAVAGQADRAVRHDQWAAHRPLVIYVIAAAAGLYILYYFAFLLVALNLWVLGFVAFGAWGATRAARAGHSGFPRRLPVRWVCAWCAAQIAVLLLYAPWLSTAWRQAMDPPVPPWRSFVPPWRMAAETWSALSLGQSVDPGRAWPLLVIAAILFGLGLLWHHWCPATRRDPHPSQDLTCLASLPAVHALLPMVLIGLISLATPLYHVRYAFTYSPPFALVLAAGAVALFRSRPWARLLAGLLLVAMVTASGLSLHRMWTDSAYASDDHRAAARFLSERWRPGDAILVNAGYSYTALLTYFQQPVAWRGRLSEYAGNVSMDQGAVILQTGHIEGDRDLGWGDPMSDFYALPGELAEEKLAQVFGGHPRVWHYRIYDTVNDPEGKIRRLLDADGELFEDRLFGGEASMRVEGYLPRMRAATPPRDARSARFGDALTLYMSPCCGAVAAGSFLDVAAYWKVDRQPMVDYATSLRLIDGEGRLWSQPPDEHPLGSLYGTSDWPTGSLERQPLRLPVPGDTPPGPYHVELLVYEPASGTPLPVQTVSAESELSVADGTRLRLGIAEVFVSRELTAMECRRPLALFAYVGLLEASTPATQLSRGDIVPVDLRWCPAASDDVEDFLTVLELRAQDERVVASAKGRPADGRYPTTEWLPGLVVRDQRQILVPTDAPSGRYRLMLALDRADDGQRVVARQGPLGLRRDEWVVVQTVEVLP
jgi:hypothetical protein